MRRWRRCEQDPDRVILRVDGDAECVGTDISRVRRHHPGGGGRSGGRQAEVGRARSPPPGYAAPQTDALKLGSGREAVMLATDWGMGDVIWTMFAFLFWCAAIWIFIMVFADIFRRGRHRRRREGGVDPADLHRPVLRRPDLPHRSAAGERCGGRDERGKLLGNQPDAIGRRDGQGRAPQRRRAQSAGQARRVKRRRSPVTRVGNRLPTVRIRSRCSRSRTRPVNRTSCRCAMVACSFRRSRSTAAPPRSWPPTSRTRREPA